MTPHPRGLAVPFSRSFVRRSALVLAACVAIAGAPLVASALDSEQPSAITATTSAPVSLAASPAAAPTPAVTLPQTLAPTIPELDADPIVDPVIAVLAAGYTWNESGLRVITLQETLGVTADGWYSYATQQAHRRAFEHLGLPADALPAPLVPFGTDERQWAALRDCESNGNYAIVNRSGKYRGAYQFDRSTWNSVAERHAPWLVGVDPAAASPGDQDSMAFALYGERGARPWPQCGRHLP